MLKQIKMSYADKDIRLTVDENDKLVKAEIRKEGDPNKFEEVKSSWVGKTPSWNKLDEVLSEIAGVKVQKRRLFECFDSVKAELHDAPVEVKESFNEVIGWFAVDHSHFLAEDKFLEDKKVFKVGIPKREKYRSGIIGYKWYSDKLMTKEEAYKLANDLIKNNDKFLDGKTYKDFMLVHKDRKESQKLVKEAREKGLLPLPDYLKKK